MTLIDIAASLTAERSLAKYTGGRERPSRDEVARLAYHFYEIRGWRHGHDVDDWLAAVLPSESSARRPLRCRGAPRSPPATSPSRPLAGAPGSAGIGAPCGPSLSRTV